MQHNLPSYSIIMTLKHRPSRYNAPEVRKVCVKIMSEWANSDKLPRTLTLNMYDMELCPAFFNFQDLVEETEEGVSLQKLPVRYGCVESNICVRLMCPYPINSNNSVANKYIHMQLQGGQGHATRGTRQLRKGQARQERTVEEVQRGVQAHGSHARGF